MTLKQTDELLKLLRSHNVSHFKSLNVEVRLESPNFTHTSQLSVKSHVPEEALSKQSAAVAPPTAAAAPPVEMTIPHHVNEVANMLKLSDNDLAMKMWPDPNDKIEGA